MERSREFSEKIPEVKVSRSERSRLNQEKEQTEESQNYESGYSEAQQALDIEMRSGDLSSLKKSNTFQSLTGNTKRLVAYRTITFRLKDALIVYVGLLQNHPHQAQKLLAEVLTLRDAQTYVFNLIVGKTNEEVDITQIPEDLREFLI